MCYVLLVNHCKYSILVMTWTVKRFSTTTLILFFSFFLISWKQANKKKKIKKRIKNFSMQITSCFSVTQWTLLYRGKKQLHASSSFAFCYMWFLHNTSKIKMWCFLGLSYSVLQMIQFRKPPDSFCKPEEIPVIQL